MSSVSEPVPRDGSGTRPSAEVWYSLASLRNGQLLECSFNGLARKKLEELATSVPTLLALQDTSLLEPLWERLGSEGGKSAFGEILLISEQYVHVIKLLTKRPSVALLVIASVERSMGFVFAAVRAKFAQFDAE